MKTKKEKIETTKIGINLPKSWVAKLRELAHLESLKTGKDIEYTELIRGAIKQEYQEIRDLT